MGTYFRYPARRVQFFGLLLVAVCGAIAAFASVAMTGTKTGAVLSVILTAGPALVYAVIVSPIVFPFGLYATMTPFDAVLDLPAFGTVTKVIGIATGAALAFYMLRTKRFVDPPRSAGLWILLYLWMLASMFWAEDVESAQKLLPTSLGLVGMYLVAAMMPMTMKWLRIACGSAALGGTLAALYGLHLYRSGIAQYKDRLWVHTDSSSWNPDHYAGSLLLPIAICLITLLWSRVVALRIAAGVGVCAMLMAMVYTGARGAALGVIAMVIYLVIRDRHRVQIAVVGGILGAVALVIEGPKYLSRWHAAATDGGAGRISIWHVGVHAFAQNWLFGAGYGNFPFAYDRAFIGVYESFYADWHRASHNILLNTSVELGVIGLIMLLLAWWGQFRMLRGIPETDERWPLRLGLEAALIALFVSGMFADIMIEKYVWLAFMLIALTYNASPQRVHQRASPQRIQTANA